MADEQPRFLYKGTSETFEVRIDADADLTGTVTISFDKGTTFLEAAWTGTVGPSRVASLTVSNANLPAFPFDNRLLANVAGTIIDVGHVIGKAVPLT